MNVLTVIIVVVSAILIFVLRQFELQFLVGEWTLKTYVAIIATAFLLIGLIVGLYLKRGGVTSSTEEVAETNIAQKLVNSHLSARETELMVLVAKGLSNREIAQTLFVSEHTVKKHLNNIYTKLDVTRRTQAVKKARELGIIQV